MNNSFLKLKMILMNIIFVTRYYLENLNTKAIFYIFVNYRIL